RGAAHGRRVPSLPQRRRRGAGSARGRDHGGGLGDRRRAPGLRRAPQSDRRRARDLLFRRQGGAQQPCRQVAADQDARGQGHLLRRRQVARGLRRPGGVDRGELAEAEFRTGGDRPAGRRTGRGPGDLGRIRAGDRAAQGGTRRMSWHDNPVYIVGNFLFDSPFRTLWPLVAAPALAALFSDRAARLLPQQGAAWPAAAALAAAPGLLGAAVICQAMNLDHVITWRGVFYLRIAPFVAALLAAYAI